VNLAEQEFVNNYLEESRQAQEDFIHSAVAKKAIFDCADSISDAIRSGHK
jgi:hypothetical protein